MTLFSHPRRVRHRFAWFSRDVAESYLLHVPLASPPINQKKSQINQKKKSEQARTRFLVAPTHAQQRTGDRNPPHPSVRQPPICAPIIQPYNLTAHPSIGASQLGLVICARLLSINVYASHIS
ncbi:hypothetical protein BC826DRAFT_466197 [Russula brevipes]|nr:hypothetical protein BC826DRAFT_466197 [Russula brevipes]